MKLVNPQADFEQSGYPVTASLDGNPGTAWSIDPRIGSNHAVIYEVEPTQQSGFAGGATLTFTLDFQFNNKHAIGRFRLSVSGEPPAPDRQRQRFAARNFTDPWAMLAAAYALNGREDRAAEYFGRTLARADGYEARQPILQFAAQFGDVLSELIKRPAR